MFAPRSLDFEIGSQQTSNDPSVTFIHTKREKKAGLAARRQLLNTLTYTALLRFYSFYAILILPVVQLSPKPVRPSLSLFGPRLASNIGQFI